MMQQYRDLANGITLLLACWIYIYALDEYLSVLSNPKPLFFIFLFSFVLAIVYELKPGISRVSLSQVAMTVVVFMFAAFLADMFRTFYLEIVRQLGDSEDLVNAIGYEYVGAVANPAVGIGACFGAALALLRIPLRGMLSKLFILLFVCPVNRNSQCPSCGTYVPQKYLNS